MDVHDRPAASGLGSTTIGGISWLTFGAGIQAVLQLIVLAVLARAVAPEEFGIVAAVVTVFAIGQIVVSSGIGSVLVQLSILESTHVRVGFTLSVAIGVVLSMGMYWSAPTIAGAFRIPEIEPVARVLSFGLLIHGVGVVAEQLVSRQLRFATLAKMDIGSYAIGYAIVAIVMAHMGFGAWALVWAALGQVVVKTVLANWCARPDMRPLIDSHALRDFLRLGPGYTFARMASAVANNVDNLIVGRYLGAEGLGFYSRAYLLMALPARLYGRAAERAAFSTMARVSDERERLRRAHLKGIELSAAFTLPASALCFVLAEQIVLVVLGGQWLDVVVPLQILAIAMYFRVGYLVSATIHRACGSVVRDSVIQVVFAALVVIGAMIGVRSGIVGVAIAVSLVMAVLFGVSLVSARRLSQLASRDALLAHRAPLVSAIIVGATAAGALRLCADALPAALVLIACGTSALLALLLVAWRAPTIVVGDATRETISLVVNKARTSWNAAGQ